MLGRETPKLNKRIIKRKKEINGKEGKPRSITL